MARVEAYTYDPAVPTRDRDADGALVATYGYDANGNRTSTTMSGGPATATYDAQDRLQQWGSTTYAYTAAGELLTKTEPGVGTTTYTYDVQGTLRQVALPTGTVIDYRVDALNRRIGRLVNGVKSHGWLWAGTLRPVAELDAAGAVVSRFVYGTGINVPDYLVRGGQTYRLVTDHIGSVRLVVNVASGAVVQQLDYDAWGQVTLDTNPGWQPFGFAGGLYDPVTGLVRFGARDYDPETGRWAAKEPLGFNGGDTNLYAYVSDDPVNWVDPSGRTKLPANPSGLGPEWTPDLSHRDPNGQRFRDPSGNSLDFHRGRPGLPGERGKDHWHYNEGEEHLHKGDEIPDTDASFCSTAKDSTAWSLPSISIPTPNPCIAAFGLLGATIGGIGGSVVPVAGNAAGAAIGFSVGGAIGGAAIGLAGGYIGCQ